MHEYTHDQQNFIKENAKGKNTNELTELFNQHFGLNLGINQIRAYKKNHNLKSDVDCRFKKGQSSFNKGMKKYWIGGEETQFKKGNKPHNYMSVGSERVNGDDYVDIKIADPNKWKGKHIIVWERHNGPIPKGHCIIFGDGNNRNFNINNLICISRKQLIILNNNGLIQKDADLTRIGIVIADVKSKMSEVKKR